MSGSQARFAHAASCENGVILGVKGIHGSGHGETVGINRDLCASALRVYPLGGYTCTPRKGKVLG